MNRRSLLLFSIAAIVALGVAFVLRNRLNSDADKINQVTVMSRVMVASSDIAPGSFIRPDKDLTWVEWPSENINASYLVEGKADKASYAGSVVRRYVREGEPVTEDLLVQAGEGGFMAAVLGAGKRAISIAVDPTTGNAGFIFPGDKVDLILTHNIPVTGLAENNEDVVASETFIEDVRVLAVDQQLDNPENQAILAKTVTLEVTKEQAQKINVAKDLGKISLSLRSLAVETYEQRQAQDIKNYDGSATRDSDVSSVLSPRAYSTIRNVTVIRGDKRELLEFSN